LTVPLEPLNGDQAMLKGILGIVGGLVASMAVIVIFQKVGQLIYPMPAGLDMQDKGRWARGSSRCPSARS
jgi:hypothetical protein